MRTFVLVCLFAVAATAAVLPEASYLPPEEKLSSEYLAPSEEEAEVKDAADAPLESAALAEDGYQYKTVKTLKYRQRRDVSEIANEYLPPSEGLSSEYIPPAEVKAAVEVVEASEESGVLADDGYRYKTIRKLKYRNRRDVAEVVAAEYLPPAKEVSPEYIPPAEVKEAVEIVEAPEESAVLADDGYQYKTIRKLKYRNRRDVSEVVAPEYLPPAKEVSPEYIPPAEVKEAVEAVDAPEESAVLADDGYRYKTIRKLKYRNRRDVSEIVAPEYLPPAKEVSPEYVPPAEVKEVVEAVEEVEAPEESAILADDGYRYKTIRKLKYRNRRDVSEVVAPEYLPPAKEVSPEYVPPAEGKEAVEAVDAPEESAVLADDGYRYKTIRKLKYRNRRDVSEIVAPEYLPPAKEVSPEYIPPAEVKEAVEAVDAPEESAVLADDGYRYKTIRKLKYRNRRDVSEVVAPEYLPPAKEVSPEYVPPAEVKEAVEAVEEIEAPEESAILADDGYRYKTIRKLKYRNRRDVSEVVAPEYLPPAKEVSPEYIPPAEVKEAVEAVEEVEAPEESAILADDGYRYKTIRKLKYRNRRDVSEVVAPEYLPPAKEVSPEYIPPAEVKEAVEAVEEVEAPEESAILADDGYRYKTIRKLKYRQRRDVSEIVEPKYLPPVEKSALEYLPPVEQESEVTEAPVEESAVLADDGYHYKTVKRIRYRH